jgi:hypothetical protein
MNRIACRLLFLPALLAPFHGLSAQTTLNPDISVIPRFLVETNDAEPASDGTRKFSQPDFSFQELELVAGAYLNPYARADVVLAIAGPDLESPELSLEEVYATILRGLPLDLNIRLGKYRIEYGKLNMVHPHVWSFVTQPLSQSRFLGEEGLNDLAVSVSILLPTGDVYSRLNVDLLRGGAFGETIGIEDTTGGNPTYGGSARLMGFFPLGDDGDLEIGVSGLTGIHDPYYSRRFWYVNGDLKYKYRPDMYTSLVIQGEFLYNMRNAGQDADFNQFGVVKKINSYGLYGFIDYQFLKIYSIGIRYDLSQTPYSTTDKIHAGSVFLGYYPVEETLGFRLHYQHTRSLEPGVTEYVNFIGLQAVFSLGPHKAHPF